MRFRVPVLAIEGVPTDDNRTFRQIEWRDLPLTLYAQHTNAPGHDNAPIAGSLDEIVRGEGGVLEAVIDTDDDGEHGRETARLIMREDLRGISVDLGLDESTVEIVEHEGEDGSWWMELVVGRATILAATVVGMPAFGQANQIDPNPMDDMPEDMMEPEDEQASAQPDTQAQVRLVASVRERVGVLPAAAWFTDPALPLPSPLTVVDAPGGWRRIIGHLAQWGTCHIGFDGACVTPPHSEAGYAYFHTGELDVACDDCDGTAATIRVGTLTMDTGHASARAGATPAAAHYDDTGVQAAWGCVGEDDHGIWFAGVVNPEVAADENRLRRLRASAGSGDWRRIGGNLELVGLLAVNVPGFPVVTRELVAAGTVPGSEELRTRFHVEHGVQTSLVAAGIVWPDEGGVLLESAPDPRVDALIRDRVGGTEYVRVREQ